MNKVLNTKEIIERMNNIDKAFSDFILNNTNFDQMEDKTFSKIITIDNMRRQNLEQLNKSLAFFKSFDKEIEIED